jgi:hypothetical protein
MLLLIRISRDQVKISTYETTSFLQIYLFKDSLTRDNHNPFFTQN